MTSNDVERIGHQVLGRYRVVRRLAQGGMGVVYLGRIEGAAGFSKPVVIKRIISDPEDQQGSTARFIREAQILSNLQHPGIVGVLDFGEEDEQYSMVLEYVQGYDLGRWLKYLQLKAQLMHWEEATFITLRVLEALGYAHGFRRNDGSSAEVLHRDISPGNVLLDVDGRVRLVDFGIARMEAGTGDLYKTQTGVLKGKVAYMAPELFAGSPPSPASDLYACGVILYHMLAGANPFTAGNDSRLMWRVIMEGPTPLSRKRDDLPPELDRALSMALERDPARRYSSAEGFAERLRKVFVRSEAEVGAALRERLRLDFNGDLPALLRLETLAERDRAWRQDPALGAALPRELAGATPSSTQPSLTQSRGREGGGGAEAPTALVNAAPTAAAARLAEPAPSAPAASRNLAWKPVVALGMAMSVVIGIAMAAALFLLQKPSPPPPESRFIVVEAPEPRAAAPVEPVVEPAAARGAAEPAAARAPAPQPEPVRASPPPRAGRAPSPGSSAALSRAFAKRERELGACFERHAADVEGKPEISISFEVDAAGKVRSAGLLPGALAETPLGGCLLRVARTTAFGRVGKTTRFTIPIRAAASR